jgi:hypothetical protein
MKVSSALTAALSLVFAELNLIVGRLRGEALHVYSYHDLGKVVVELAS